MPHISPTTFAESQVLDPARLSQAGRGEILTCCANQFCPRLEIRRRYAALELFWCQGPGSQTEERRNLRLQLSEEVKISLADEIELMQEITRSFVRAAKMGGEETYPANLAKTLYLLGLSCGKIALLMRTHVNLTGNQSAILSQKLLEALTAYNEEIEETHGTANPDQA